MSIDDRLVALQLWDTAGQERFINFSEYIISFSI